MRDNYSSKIPKSLIPYTLPNNWTWFFWSDIMKSYQQGMIRSNRELGEGNVYYLKMGDLNDNGVVNLTDLSITNATEKEIKEFQLTEGDFLINVRNSRELVGKTCVIRKIDKTILYNHMLVRINNGSPEMNYFINAFLNIPSSKKLLDRIKQGTTTVIALYQRELNQLPIPLPDTLTFNTIISLYKSIDAKIELNNHINRELEAMAKTLYDYWFVQFDFPYSPPTEGCPQDGVGIGKPYKSSGGKMVYNAELKREIPVGWEVKKIGKVLSTKLGGTPSTEIKEYWINGEFHWLNSGEIANFPIITSELKITKKAIENSSTYLLPKGTIAISITRHIRPSILAIDSCANQSVIGILESKELKSSYLYPLIKNEIPRYLSLRTGAQQPHINKQTIDKTNIIIPDKETLKKYYQVSNQFYERIKNNAFQNQHLSELRDWLLPMLMNGQVTVAEAEKAVYNLEETMGVAAEPVEKYT